MYNKIILFFIILIKIDENLYIGDLTISISKNKLKKNCSKNTIKCKIKSY